MRLWSLHPRYLDQKGLVAVWREGLLAQAVLTGQTRGYKYHPQLKRFLESSAPKSQIAHYLHAVHAEATRRRYNFDVKKIGRTTGMESVAVTRGQLEYEWAHLVNKLKTRAPVWLGEIQRVEQPESHPLFHVIDGGVAEWEIIAISRV